MNIWLVALIVVVSWSAAFLLGLRWGHKAAWKHASETVSYENFHQWLNHHMLVNNLVMIEKEVAIRHGIHDKPTQQQSTHDSGGDHTQCED